MVFLGSGMRRDFRREVSETHDVGGEDQCGETPEETRPHEVREEFGVEAKTLEPAPACSAATHRPPSSS